MTKKLALCLLTALLPGCLSNVVTLKPEAKSIAIVHETDKPLRCDVLGKISGMSRSKFALLDGNVNDLRWSGAIPSRVDMRRRGLLPAVDYHLPCNPCVNTGRFQVELTGIRLAS